MERGLIKLGPSLALNRVWTGSPGKCWMGAMISGGPCQNRGQSIDSTDDPRFNPNRGEEYHISGAIYTRAQSEWELIKFGPPLAVIRVWVAGPGKLMWGGP